MQENKENKNKIFKPIMLSYNNQTAEHNYQKYLQTMLNQQFLTIGLFLSIIYLLYFISNVIWFNDYLNGFIRLFQSIIMLLSIFISRKFKKKVIIWSLFAQEIVHVILNTELFIMKRILLNTQPQQDKSEFYSFGISIAIYIFSICYVTKQWYLKFFQVLLINYPIMRMNSQFNLSLFIIQLFLFYFGLVFYLQERSERIHYYNYYEQGKNINEFKFFLNSLMPAPCFVISKDCTQQINKQASEGSKLKKKQMDIEKMKIIFFNKKCLQEFQISNQQDIIEKLQNFQYEKSDLPNKQIQQNLNQINLSQIINKEIDKLQEDIRQKNLNQLELTYDLYNEITLLNYHYNDCLIDQKLENGDDSEKYYDIKVVQCIWDKQPSLMVMFYNISQKIQNYRLKATDQYKDQLLASVTHDLKNPLNGIITMLQSSLHMGDIKSLKQINSLILKNAQLFSYLINDILDYSQIIKGKLRLIQNLFSLKQLINEVFSLFQFSAKQKGLTLILDSNISLNGQCFIFSDENRLKQILINLIGNAIKFTQKGSISILVEESKQYQNCLNISVKDTGTGIPQQIQNQLFQPFATFDNQLGSNKFGIGLGLYICKQLVKELGPIDQIKLTSSQNIGSCFSFLIYKSMGNKSEELTNNNGEQIFQDYFSKDLINDDEIIEEKSDIDNFDQNIKKVTQRNNFKNKSNIFEQKKSCFSEQSHQQVSRQNSLQSIDNLNSSNEVNYFSHLFKIPTHILIVDDDQFNLYGFCCLMKPFDNVIIDKAYNGKEALEKINLAQKQNNQYKYVLTDINMPIMNGFEEIKQIKQLITNKQINNLIIISITSDNEDKQKSLQLGANYALNKPIIYSEIINVFQQFTQEII